MSPTSKKPKKADVELDPNVFMGNRNRKEIELLHQMIFPYYRHECVYLSPNIGYEPTRGFTYRFGDENGRR